MLSFTVVRARKPQSEKGGEIHLKQDIQYLISQSISFEGESKLEMDATNFIVKATIRK